MRIGLFCFLFLAGACLLMTGPTLAKDSADTEKCFATSLHHTTRGMEHWYDAKDGFSAVTGVPYKDLGCKNCHVTSCNDCHLVKTEKGYAYSTEKAKKSETCLKCHSREKATLSMDKARGFESVHMTKMSCSECHSQREVHGDGTCYESMRAPGALDTKCTNCHTQDGGEGPDVPDSKSHKIHTEKLDCTACHVSNTMTCYNCHFGVLKETGKKSESFAAKAKDFLLLVKYDGKVTSGTLQTLVGPDNYPFVTYVPYLTHSIMAEGRTCEQCHATEAVSALAKGEKYAPGIVQDGKLSFKKGVIPLVPDLLDWPFLEKKKGAWVPFTPINKPMVQLGVYAEPFNTDELKKMNTKQTYTP
ncbi:hypothetical protein GO013_02025 [Pseudodesulfovibrio sp. JC047]|uniref:hypothetical protein n=1 Tax=Pseudodesulfovibrio sp. JC047 TaxID=2683199 RepID=UPI0013D0B42A|nr:hypothetical protein [Pseudodesulfovibrio sp. JC047]NDV18195.1 hypothetical protein [Pseudodesulfovibrio sp. JC047]